MTRTLILTWNDPESSPLLLDFCDQEEIESIGLSLQSADFLREIPRITPEVILLELDKPVQVALEVIQSVLATFPVPLIVVGPDAKASERKLKKAGAAAVLSNGDGQLATIARHIRILRGLKIVRPKSNLKRLASTKPRFLLIASSSGGPSVVRAILKGVQPGSGLIVAIAQHLSAHNLPTFQAWLSKETAWQMVICNKPTKPVEGRVYLAAAGCHLVWSKGRLVSLPSRGNLEFVPSANRLFESFAKSRDAASVIALVLSGMGKDGTEGLLQLKAAGAKTMAQAPKDAKVTGMPKSAVYSGAAQCVVPNRYLVSAILGDSSS